MMSNQAGAGRNADDSSGDQLFDRRLLDAVVATGTREHVRGGELLFTEGDAADCLYLVESGRLRVFRTVDGAESTIRFLVPGDVVGELALLSGAARAASVRAVRDSNLVRVTSEEFQALLVSDTTFTRALVRALGEKLRTRSGAPTESRPPSRVFAVVPLGPGPHALQVAQTLAVAMGDPDGLWVGPNHAAGDEISWGSMLDAMERQSRTVVLVGNADPGLEAWTSFCQRQADRVVAVAAEPPTGQVSVRKSWDLVVCAHAIAARRTWIARMQPRSLHALTNLSNQSDLDRLARRLTGTSTGIVLSGGGARGLAHLGVLHALAEAGVAIDRLGGTSMGAFISALTADGRSTPESVQLIRDELISRHPFRDYTWPRVSLIRARRARTMLTRIFGDRHLEDLDRDCFCVSADLSTADVVVHRQGSIVTAVGASMSLPGLAPPVRDGGRLLVDGGVLNNVPVDIMQATGEGPVIAVDVMAHSPPRHVGRLPSIVETLARATVIGSHHHAPERLAAAHVVIAPRLDTIGLLDFGRYDEIIEAGRTAALRALDAGALEALATAPVTTDVTPAPGPS